jgi:hypothetical protein
MGRVVDPLVDHAGRYDSAEDVTKRTSGPGQTDRLGTDGQVHGGAIGEYSQAIVDGTRFLGRTGNGKDWE